MLYPFTLECQCWAMTETEPCKGAREDCGQSSTDADFKIEKECNTALVAARNLLRKELGKRMFELWKVVAAYESKDCQPNDSQSELQFSCAEKPTNNSSDRMGAAIDASPHNLHPDVNLPTESAPVSGLEKFKHVMMQNECLLQEQSALMRLYSKEVSKMRQNTRELGDPDLMELPELHDNHQRLLRERKVLQELWAEQHHGLIRDMKRIKMMPLESSKFDGAAHGHARENEFKPVLSSNPLCGWQHAFFAEGTGDNRGELQPVAWEDTDDWCSLQQLAHKINKEQLIEDIEDSTLTMCTKQSDTASTSSYSSHDELPTPCCVD